jgi:hypothetical protein
MTRNDRLRECENEDKRRELRNRETKEVNVGHQEAGITKNSLLSPISFLLRQYLPREYPNVGPTRYIDLTMLLPIRHQQCALFERYISLPLLTLGVSTRTRNWSVMGGCVGTRARLGVGGVRVSNHSLLIFGIDAPSFLLCVFEN